MRSVRTFQTFLAVVRHGSFTAASQAIGLTPAAIGLQIRGLEEELNRQLFDRTARAVVLSAAGRKLVPAIEDLVLRYETLAAGDGAGADELAGTVVMGALTSALMGSFADALWTIKKQYPRLEVRLLAGQSDDFTRKVAHGELDGAVVVRSPGVLPLNLIWTPLYRESMILIAPRHPHFDLPSDPIEVLRACPFIRFDRNTWTGYLVSEVLRQCNVSPVDAMELNSFEAIMEIVRQGFGMAIVPKLANVDWSSDRGLKIIPLPCVEIARDVGLLERTSHPRTGFTDAIKQCFIASKGRARRQVRL
jgi:DNA-binding transcriptional LysR family regulator